MLSHLKSKVDVNCRSMSTEGKHRKFLESTRAVLSFRLPPIIGMEMRVPARWKYHNLDGPLLYFSSRRFRWILKGSKIHLEDFSKMSLELLNPSSCWNSLILLLPVRQTDVKSFHQTGGWSRSNIEAKQTLLSIKLVLAGHDTHSCSNWFSSQILLDQWPKQDSKELWLACKNLVQVCTKLVHRSGADMNKSNANVCICTRFVHNCTRAVFHFRQITDKYTYQ